MLAFISFLLVCIGSLNWFTIGLLQYDFVAGLFGSQANIFSRLVYALVGVASIVVIFNLIKNKGKFVISFKKANKEFEEMKEKKEEKKKKEVLKQNPRFSTSTETSNEFYDKEHDNLYDKERDEKTFDTKYYTHKKDDNDE